MHRITTRAAIMLFLATFATGCDASRGAMAQAFTRAGAGRESATAVAGASGAPGANGAAGQSVTTETHAGNGDLPAGWPGDLAVPPGSHLGATTSITTGDTTLQSVSGSVMLPSHVVRAHFEEQFAGWTAGDERWGGGVATWTKGLARARVVVGAQADGATGFTIRLE